MKKLSVRFHALALLLVALIVSCGPQAAHAQAVVASTTLSAAVSTTSGQTFTLTSLTGIAPTQSQSFSGFVDSEFVTIQSTLSTNSTIRVTRGQAGTVAKTHNSGAVFYFAPSNFFSMNEQSGSCTSTQLLYLPAINTLTGHIFDCRSDGQWINILNGTMSSAASASYSQFCTGTVATAATEFLNGAACSGASAATARIVVPSAGQIANLRVFSSAAVVGGTSVDVLTVLKNGVATSLTCTIAAAGTTCNDVTHAFIVAAGDVLTFSFVTATSDTAANITAGVERF